MIKDSKSLRNESKLGVTLGLLRGDSSIALKNTWDSLNLGTTNLNHFLLMTNLLKLSDWLSASPDEATRSARLQLAQLASRKLATARAERTERREA
jgi:hypothetical protein